MPGVFHLRCPNASLRTVRKVGVLLASFGLLLWLLLPAVGIWLLWERATALQLADTSYVSAPIEATQGSLSSQIGIAVDWAKAPSLVAPEWSGLVQSVSVQPGSEIVHGTEIAMVGGIRRIAWQTAVPFSQPLGLDARGADVRQLNDALRSHGLDAPDSDRFDWRTLRAAREFAAQIGVSDPRDLTTFDPAWVVYLPAPTTAGEVDLVVGAPAPSGGTEIVVGADVVTAGYFVDTAVVDSLLSQEGEGPTSAVLSESSLHSIASGSAVKLGDREITVDATTPNQVAAASLAAVQTQLQAGARASIATLEISAPADAWTVPTASISVDEQGRTCVLVDGDDLGTGVEVVVSTESRVVVLADLTAEDRLVLYPTGVACS